MFRYEYATTKDMAEYWGVSSAWVSQLCKQGRVLGAEKIGNMWVIPRDTARPQDFRVWNGRSRKRSRRKR